MNIRLLVTVTLGCTQYRDCSLLGRLWHMNQGMVSKNGMVLVTILGVVHAVNFHIDYLGKSCSGLYREQMTCVSL